jgi:hypothetical protein
MRRIRTNTIRRRRCSRCGDLSESTATRIVTGTRGHRVTTRAEQDALLADLAPERRSR